MPPGPGRGFRPSGRGRAGFLPWAQLEAELDEAADHGQHAAGAELSPGNFDPVDWDCPDFRALVQQMPGQVHIKTKPALGEFGGTGAPSGDGQDFAAALGFRDREAEQHFNEAPEKVTGKAAAGVALHHCVIRPGAHRINGPGGGARGQHAEPGRFLRRDRSIGIDKSYMGMQRAGGFPSGINGPAFAGIGIAQQGGEQGGLGSPEPGQITIEPALFFGAGSIVHDQHVHRGSGGAQGREQARQELGQPHAFTQAGDDKQGPHKNGSGRDRGVERGAAAAQRGTAVHAALERLMAGRTTLLIAHRLSTIMHANTIFVLEKGRIVESGDHGALLERKSGTTAAAEKKLTAYAEHLRRQGGMASETAPARRAAPVAVAEGRLPGVVLPDLSQIAQRHGGRVRCEANEGGRGSCFLLSLPLS